MTAWWRNRSISSPWITIGGARLHVQTGNWKQMKRPSQWDRMGVSITFASAML